jgi:CDP-4-dehydro-6-deoxyglucose reductase/ferredoxin-NAD(P)+ reductase (naphthalene dioxygenase ferredoxin-specific)
MGHTVTVANTGAVLDCGAEQTVLQAAVLAGVDYPYTCATGNCAACVSQLRSGEVTMLAYSDNALSAAQRGDGRILACRARPVSDVTVEWLGRGRR